MTMPPATATTTTPIATFFQTFILDSLLYSSGASLSSDCPCSVNTLLQDRKFPSVRPQFHLKFGGSGRARKTQNLAPAWSEDIDGRAPNLVFIVVDSEKYWKGCLTDSTSVNRG